MTELLYIILFSVVLQAILGKEDFSTFVKLAVFLWMFEFIASHIKYIGAIFLIG